MAKSATSMANAKDQAALTSQSWGARGTARVSFAAALSLDNVSVNFGEKTVLDQLSIALEPGEIVCLLGESGSGKSTILRVAAGIQPVQSGTVRVNDSIVDGEGVFVPPQSRGVGLMFQDFALFPHMSVLQNAKFGLRGLSRKDAQTQAEIALERVGLAHLAQNYPHMLSGGQQQRLALARAIAPRPGILMLDEPFSGLDTRLRESVRAEALAVLRETRATTVIVTHDPEEAMLLADRIAMLRNGQIVQFAPPAELYAHPKDLSAARFLSPLTEIYTKVKNGMAATPLGNVAVSNHADGTPVTVALRPTSCVEFADQGQGTLGRIVEKREALGIDICEVAVDGLDTLIHLRTPSKRDLRVGTNVYLTLVEDRALVFTTG